MKTLVCCIAKMENLYLREWVEWYRGQGFTNVCLYDNNDVDGEHFEEVIKDYIDSGFVIVKDFRGMAVAQMKAYQDCYDTYKDEYDWIGFFDADEYFETDNDDVSAFLSQEQFKDFQGLRICWKNYDDSGRLTVEDGDYSIKRFTTTVERTDICNRTSKVFLRGGQEGLTFLQRQGGEHGLGLKCKICDAHGKECDNRTFVLSESIWDGAWLNHYRFKTLWEYCTLKLKRLYPNQTAESAKMALRKKDFFEYNQWTTEKDRLFHELTDTNVVCCIFNYGKDENALSWYNRCKTHYKTYLLDTYYLEKGEAWPFDKENQNIISLENIFVGGLTIKAYELMKKDKGQWLMIINSDVECDAQNFDNLTLVVEEVLRRKDIGVWEPTAKMGSMCNGATIVIPDNIHQFNHGTGKMREVRSGEGWFEFVRVDICDEVIPHLDMEENKYGWGVNDAFNRVARKKGLKVVLDDRVTVFHPQGTGYNNQAAKVEYDRFKTKFEELGIAEPADKPAEEIKTLVCCIGKNENRYVREYVEWYKKLGVTNIRLYDNNDLDGEHFEDVIKDYIDSGFVEVVDYRGRKECQHQAYTECYHEKKNDYDWILFIDCGDEYLAFAQDTGLKDIQHYLAMPQFINFDLIHINLMTFGDNDLVEYEDKPLNVRFTKPISFDKTVAYPNIPEDAHVSSIVRGGLEDIKWEGHGFTHTPSPNNLRCCNNIGVTTDGNSPFQPVNFQLAGFKHYTTKTASEYCDKMKRGFPDQKWDGSRIQNLIETRFFRTNEVTEEKVKVFKEKLGIDMSYLLPKKFEGKKSDDVKIYTLCYEKKDFQFLDDEVITPLQVGAANGTNVCDLKDNTGENISDKNYFYIENTGTYWIWKNVHAKYKGQMQYRRPLSGVCSTMDFEEIFKDHDVITCEPFYHPAHKEPTKEEPMVIVADTVEQGYAFSNCIDDLYVLEMVIKMFHPEYSESYDKYIKNGPNLYYSSGYIMKGEDYDRYCEFLFDCLDKWLEFANVHSKEELYAHVKYNLEVGKYPRYGGNKNIVNDEKVVRWQSSIGGFLGERIWTLWLLHNFSEERILKLPYIKMEKNMYT